MKARTATVEERAELVTLIWDEMAGRQLNRNSAVSVCASVILNVLLDCKTWDDARNSLDAVYAELEKSLTQYWLLGRDGPEGPSSVN